MEVTNGRARIFRHGRRRLTVSGDALNPAVMATIANLEVFPLNLGGNVFGWTPTRRSRSPCSTPTSPAGGNFIDTADVYSAWVDGHAGGESETMHRALDRRRAA